MEWIGEVAQPLAMRVMLRMLGIGANEEARWQRWSAKRARLLEMIATRSERKTAHITGESITRYFRELLAERARSEGDDVISALAREAARAEFINTAEAADMLGVIMIAGNETTANLIGNGLWALMRHPEQMERLREEPERARDAINEVLRYDSPVQTDFRIAKSEAVSGGKTIRAGEGVILLTGSANHDEAAFSEPDRLDIARKGPKHAAFGHGVHQCIGAELARMETSAVIVSAAARFERITLAGPDLRVGCRQKWGASAAMRITPSASGRGLTLSIAPQWGRTGSDCISLPGSCLPRHGRGSSDQPDDSFRRKGDT